MLRTILTLLFACSTGATICPGRVRCFTKPIGGCFRGDNGPT